LTLAGGLGRAIPLLEQALADCVRVLGPNHPDTLKSRNNLANAYRAAGDLGRAIPLLRKTLADSVRVLGADHPKTKLVRANLAAARQHLSNAPPGVRAAPGGGRHAGGAGARSRRSD
jgi:Tetratricopeptide repeat